MDTNSSGLPLAPMFESFIAMKAIDLTAFMGQWPTRLQVRAEAADLTAMADRYSLSGLCVSHIASIFGFDTRSGNEELLRAAEGDPRLWPFVILNPAGPAWERELEWAAAAGARGVRLLPGYHGYSLQDPQVRELVLRLTELGLPLQVCAALEDERLMHPRLKAAVPPPHEFAELLRICGDRGEVPLILSGIRPAEWNTIASHQNTGRRMERVLLDLWFTNGPFGVIQDLCKKGLSDRFAYGSCAPIQTPEATMLQLAAAPISDTDRLALCRGNAARILGIGEQ